MREEAAKRDSANVTNIGLRLNLLYVVRYYTLIRGCSMVQNRYRRLMAEDKISKWFNGSISGMTRKIGYGIAEQVCTSSLIY